MTDYSVPYVAGPSAAPVSPPVGRGPSDHPAMPRPEPAGAVAAPIVGETVDLAHELAALRKLQTTTALIAGVTLVLALVSVVMSGFVAYVAWTLLGALEKAFG
jgi:hypothetical protein